ncbi:MAG: hypothetical protein ACI4A5_01205 [Hominilimicola sp.]
MKKLLAVILSSAMLASFAVMPAFADYTAAEYDILRESMTFDDGTTTNDADGTKALQIGDDFQQKIFETTVDTTQEFLLSFDFRLDSDAALIEIPKYKTSGVDKVGPRLKLSDGKLVTETSSSGGTQELGEYIVGEWYAAEIEGRTGMGSQYTTFRLYKYNSGSRELVKETESFNMRNLSSEGRSFTGMGANNASLDNIKLYSLYPDVLTVTSDDDEINAGQTLTLDYGMTRAGVETTKHAVTWSVLNASGTSEITDGSASVNENGVLSADISASAQTVTVKASVTFGEKTLSGTKQIKINAVDTSDEVFDTIAINGADTVKAGTTETYTVTASKDGTAVTPSESDVVWSLYDCDNINPYSNNNITLENGVLTVADGVIAHEICVRASSVSGQVYGVKKIAINFGDSQKEALIYYNAFETALSGTNKAVSVDGSQSYLVTEQDDVWQVENHSEYTLTEMDIKFTAEGAGFILMRRDAGKTETQITYSDGVLKTNAGAVMTDADMETWYHIELLYSSQKADASCNIYPYNADGSLGTAVTSLNIDRRNGDSFGRLRILAGSCIDNVKISTPAANEIAVKAPGTTVFAGETAQFTVTASRNGLPLKDAEGITWTVLDAEGLPILNNTVTINNSGLLTVSAMASAGKLTVRASSAETYGEVDITTAIAEIFTVTNVGINEDEDKIVRIYADKNFYYDDDVTFIIVIRDSEGFLKGIKSIKTFGDRLNIGANEITTDMSLPGDFNPQTDSIEVMVWTTI